MLSVMTFFVGLAAAIVIVLLSILAFVKNDFEFWPPPHPQSWQKRAFRGLFRGFFLSLVVLSFIDFQPSTTWRYVIGGTFLMVGLGCSLHWTSVLGWRDSFGEPTGLKTTGPFAWSRNPVYMATIVGMMGWALAVNSFLLTMLLALWALLYIAAPFLEEPWLEREFGEEYRSYMNRTPRYFPPFG